MLVLLRKQIKAVIRESGWGVSPSALKGGQPQLRHCPGVRLEFGCNGPDHHFPGNLGDRTKLAAILHEELCITLLCGEAYFSQCES